jgi:hypothetical protein
MYKLCCLLLDRLEGVHLLLEFLVDVDKILFIDKALEAFMRVLGL